MLSQNNDVPIAGATTGDLADNSPTAERLESSLVRLCGTFATTGMFAPNANYTLWDRDGGTCTVRIDGDTDIDGREIPAGEVTIQGIFAQ